MLKKESENFEWLEFELLQEFPNLHHFVSLSSSPKQEVILARQVHGREVRRLHHFPNEELVCDALSTNAKQCPIGIKHADCQAAILYDPVHHAACCVHSGWRGSVQNIFRESIEHMKKQYGSSPNDLLLCVGPSLGPQNAEFVHYRTELPQSFWKHQIKPNYFDFWAITKAQVCEAGILPHHIEIARLDTYAEGFFSYRRDKTQERHITAVKLL